MMFTGSKTRLLEDAQGKPVQIFVQVDGFTHIEHDDAIHPDKEGDSLMLTVTPELRRTDCIRLQFTPDTPVADVARVLRKMAVWLERDYISDGSLGYLKLMGQIEEKRQRAIDVEMRTGKRQALVHPEDPEDIPF